MEAIWQNIATSFTQMMGWELVAVLLAIAYLWLAMRENQWCWVAAFFSTIIYTVLFWQVSLLMDSALNVYYMAMAVYGWWSWQKGGRAHSGLEIRRWPVKWHLLAISAVLLVTAISGYILAKSTEAAWPYLDSFTTWASVFTTWLVARKILENWIYWIVIDTVAMGLYIERGLYLTALLFAAYVVMCFFGYQNWRKRENDLYLAETAGLGIPSSR